ncbi:MAG: xanthine dehydrogenase accessory protein XdhC, partial [Rhodoferax sp.]
TTPREAGAWMAVFSDGLCGTVGGGHLEWQAIAQARQLLALPAVPPSTQRYALGPSLGQCCGGEVWLEYRCVSAGDAHRLAALLAPRHVPLALFGAGHVGRAVVQVVAALPMDVTWIDSRDAVFDCDCPANVRCEHSDPVQAAVADLLAQSRVLVMSFSHAEDLEVVAACLQRQRERSDLPYLGLIGSRSKWAAFSHRLAQRGFGAEELAHVTCPIGIATITDKRPEVMAIAIAAQLLQVPANSVAEQGV